MKIGPEQIKAVTALPAAGASNTSSRSLPIGSSMEVGRCPMGDARPRTTERRCVLWPAKEYAAVCAINEWKGFDPRAISLSDLMEVLLPRLKRDGVLPGVFFTPSSKGGTPSVDELILALEAELQKY